MGGYGRILEELVTSTRARSARERHRIHQTNNAAISNNSKPNRTIKSKLRIDSLLLAFFSFSKSYRAIKMGGYGRILLIRLTIYVRVARARDTAQINLADTDVPCTSSFPPERKKSIHDHGEGKQMIA